MREVVRFPINTPTPVALRFELGKKVEGRYGDQIMYTLADNRVMYVPPAVEGRIQELGIPAGETFEITKQEMRNGTRKWIEWQVRRMPQQASLTEDAETNSSTVAAAAPASPPRPNGDAKGNGQPASPNLPAPIPEAINGSGIRHMELALAGAAEIAQRVETRASGKGYSLRFSSEDIRAIGLTLYIQAARDAGVRWQQ